MPRGGVQRIQERGRNGHRTLAALERAGDLDAALAVLERALELAELHAVPEDPEAFARFARGPLVDATRELLGDGAAAIGSALEELVQESIGDSGLYAVGSTRVTPPDGLTVGASPERSSPAMERAAAPRPLCVVVDHDEVMRSRLGRRLEQEGFLVIQCDDALGALEACIEHEPALLFCPIGMPPLDGLALARLVRARMRDAGPAVILAGEGKLAPEDAWVARLVPRDGQLTALIAEAKKLTGR